MNRVRVADGTIFRCAQMRHQKAKVRLFQRAPICHPEADVVCSPKDLAEPREPARSLRWNHARLARYHVPIRSPKAKARRFQRALLQEFSFFLLSTFRIAN